MKPVEFYSQAITELASAVEFYENRVPGLGIDFNTEVNLAVDKIRETPSRYPIYIKRTRRLLLQRFPYLVVFLDLDDKIWIVAISHRKRRPGYWHDRL